MNYFIKLDDEGNPVGYPDHIDNAKYLFPDLPPGRLPDGWVEARVTPPPAISAYQTFEEGPYVMEKGVAVKTWLVQDMTDEEIAAKQQAVKDEWAAYGPGYPSWTFDEALCCYLPPVPIPPIEEGNFKWDEDSLSWVEIESGAGAS